jgi:ribosome-associated toxin RatA of RatAB toxin-antitoxin module
MSDSSYFESRAGKVTCTAEKLFHFVTDIRNFERFIPNGKITNWQSDKESCSFQVPMLGTVSVRITHMEMYHRVVYSGDALKKNDFELTLNITDNQHNPANVKVSLNAELNPVMKLMAAKPIDQFLEMLVTEMGKFDRWDEVK